jgi:hypothetical protein
VIGIIGFHLRPRRDTMFGWSGSNAALVMWPLALIVAARWPAWSVGFLSLRTSRRAVHHDHAGVRADAVLHCLVAGMAMAATTA